MAALQEGLNAGTIRTELVAAYTDAGADGTETREHLEVEGGLPAARVHRGIL